jgi:DNA-binding MarR family transcriptional regulator
MTIKDRLILGIGMTTVERPRQLQRAANADEHNVVHALYRLEKDGLTEFKVKKSAHSPGRNLTRIRLTDKGIQRYKQLQEGK